MFCLDLLLALLFFFFFFFFNDTATTEIYTLSLHDALPISAYLPLDVSLPPARMTYMLEDSKAAIVLARADRAALLPPSVTVLEPVADTSEDAGEPPAAGSA